MTGSSSLESDPAVVSSKCENSEEECHDYLYWRS